jgi:hypothetical protein
MFSLALICIVVVQIWIQAIGRGHATPSRVFLKLFGPRSEQKTDWYSRDMSLLPVLISSFPESEHSTAGHGIGIPNLIIAHLFPGCQYRAIYCIIFAES